ncbi:MAG: ribosome-associated translation inhibitor RaiA [Alicyclobacillus sp.]|nr:ribosome-associated translation inhibitor RaiA [Alicyclobacillus sp.]
MNIQVRGDHLGVTPALQDYAQKKIGRLERFFDAPPEKEVYVTMSVERGLHRVEVTLHLSGMIFRAEERSGDMYASIDLVADKLEEQIVRYKEKLNQKFRERGVRTRVKAAEAPLMVSSVSNLDEPGNRVVRVKRFPMKPMDVEEAMMQMELLGHDFFVFRNADSDEVNVLYRRKSGHYGLIEPGV